MPAWKFRRFTHDQVRAIRKSALSIRSLARLYSRSPSSIYKIITFKSYKDVV
jgi:hypothetical protein